MYLDHVVSLKQKHELFASWPTAANEAICRLFRIQGALDSDSGSCVGGQAQKDASQHQTQKS